MNPILIAEILNNQFYSVFTKENLTNIPKCAGYPYPNISPISISPDGIQELLKKVDTKKDIPAWVLKHSATGHSCQAQHISIIEEIQYALDHRHQVDLIMLDFSKAAFDTVAHNCLLSSMVFMGKFIIGYPPG